MKLFNAEHQFSHPWEHVTLANWCKYPNPWSPQVVSVDVLNREVDLQTGKLRTERIIGCKQGMPAWIQKIFGTEGVSYFREVSEADPVNKTYTAVSKNLTCANLLIVEETITYQPNPENPQSTLLEQKAAVKAVGGYSSVRSYIEDFCVNRFKANAERGRMGLESVINSLREKDFAF